MNILDALWGGSVRPCERAVKKGSEYDRLRIEAQKLYDRFWDLLSPDAKEAFNAYSEINIDLMSISDRDFFVKGFRLGVQLLLAGIMEEGSQLPQLFDD